jgi:FkbM family methyltransferase
MRKEEEQFLEDMASVFNPHHQNALRAIAKATGLDYGGVDCGLDRDGRIVVFEANAAMLVHDEKTEVYLPLIVRRAGRVIVAVQPRMRGLLEKIQGITVVSIREIPLPDFDMHCPLLTLPRIFETRLDTIPAEVPYLTANAVERSRWERRIGGDAFRVGIVWAGNPATKRDHFRSPGLANVMPLFAVPGVEFVVLQVGPGRDDLGTIPLPPHVMDLGEEIADLTDTAAIMTGLDLVISSCTAPLHLAGALGVRTWAMLPFAPYFPWLLERTDTPWYPTMTLYRQEQPGRDWSCVVSRIAADLAVLVRSGSARYDVSAPKARQSVPADESPQGAAPDRSLKMGPTMSETFNELAQCRGGLMLYNRNDTYIGASMRKYGEFSGEETALFRVIVQPGRTVLDVGANIGVHTVELSRLTGPAGVVHAFEPQRLIYQVLCANVALNSLANVFTHHAAAGSAGGSLLVPALDPGGRHNYGGVSLLGSPRGERVPMLTIDSLDLGDCQFIKLDVEGMETEALRGAEATIGRFRPILYVENDRQARSAELISVLFQYGYRLYWHLPPIYTANNFRSDTENIFGDKVSVNMICIPAEIAQSSLTNLREVTNPSDSVIQW